MNNKKILKISIICIIFTLTFSTFSVSANPLEKNNKKLVNKLGQVTFHAFFDENYDGEQNSGEADASGATITIYWRDSLFDDWEKYLLFPQKTDSNGCWSDSLPYGHLYLINIYKDGYLHKKSNYAPPMSSDTVEFPLTYGPCCFPAGTKITMADGSYKNIEDVRIGDKVLSYDTESDSLSSWTVRILSRPIHPVYEINNGLLSATLEHPLFVKKQDEKTCWAACTPMDNAVRGMKEEIQKLETGDKLLSSGGEWIEITDISNISEPVQTYNILSFSGRNTYYANNILVYEEFPKGSTLFKIVMNQDHPLLYLINIFLQKRITLLNQII